MCTSRSFGKLVESYSEMEQATASYAARLAMKLRKEKLCTNVLSIRLLTNRFRTDLEQIYPCITIKLDHPANNTPDLIRAALLGLKKVFVKGYKFQKVEVTATSLIPEDEVQFNMFNPYKTENNEISKVLDNINRYYGKGTLKMASEGLIKKWDMRRNFLTPDYTNSWDDIIQVH